MSRCTLVACHERCERPLRLPLSRTKPWSAGLSVGGGPTVPQLVFVLSLGQRSF